jgi:RHS repeat-associated protein
MTTYVHDSFGNLTSITDPKTNQTQIGYSDLYASGVSTCSIASNSSVYPTSIIDPLGHTHKFTYYACTGKTQAEQNPNDIAAGRVGTTWKYDAMGRVTSEIYPDTGQTTITYNDSYPDSVTTSDLVTSNSSEVTTVQKDGLGRQVKTTLSSDPEGAVYTLTTYDNLGRVYQKTNPYRSTSDPTYGVTSTLYDALARPLTITNPDNTTLQWQYSGLAVTNTDEAGNQWTRTSDALGRLVQVLEPNGTTQTPTMETDYTYDLQNNLLTVTQWGGPSGSPNPQRRSYAYDSFSRLLGANNPEHRNSSDAATQTCAGAPSGTTWTTCYSYDSDSNLYTTTDNRGLMITYTVDKKNRVTQKTYSNGDATVNFTYDAYSSTNNGIDLRTGMSDASGSTNWTYDPMGRVWSESKTISGINKLVSTLYNLDGSTWKVTYPSGAVIEYTQSTAGRTLKVNDDTNNIPYAQNALYAPQGGLTSLLVGATSSYLGTTITNQYNDRLQPLVISADSPAATLLSLTYNFHLGSGDNGNVFGITNNKATTRSESFQYDTLNRLVSAQTTGTQWGVTFTYDPFGNLYQTAGISGQQVLPMSVNQYADPNSNHFTLLGYQYDAAGDVLSDGINSGCGGSAFAWNTEAEMTCGAGVNYTYDGDGARVKKSSGTIYWGGSEGGALAESDLSGNLTSEYVFLNGKRLARRDISSNKVYYYFSDMLGSASVVTDNAGNIENESDFYPFGGESVVTQNLANQHYKFTGKERDTESGNDYFGARYYSSTVGRFLSPDWSGKVEPVPYAKLDNPQSLNLYAYVMNRPVSDSDPDGHCGASGCAVPGYFGGAALRVLPTQDNSYGGDGTAWDPDSDVQAIMAQAAAQQTQLTASTLGKLGLSKSLHVTADQVAAAVLGQEFRGEGTEAAAAGAVVLLNRMIEVESGDANWGQAGGVSQKNLSKNDNLMLELISTPGQFTALSGNPGHISSILSGKSDSPEYSAALGKLRSVNIGSESLGGFRTVGSHDMGTRDQFRSNWSGEPRHGGILINHTEFF